jgi:hypothetical protein
MTTIRLGILSELLGGNSSLDPYVEPFRRVEGPLLARGVELVRSDADLILADGPQIEEIDAPCPVILFDKSDGGMFWWQFASHGGSGRSWLKARQVASIIKISRYLRSDHYNGVIAEDAYHIGQIHAAANGGLAPVPVEPIIILGEKDLNKVDIGYGFWAFACCDPLPDYHLNGGADKDLDVFCAMTMDYASPGVTYHRDLAMKTLERLTHLRTALVRGRNLCQADYMNLMRRARICVSPWGWGETTIRDYEAMFAGCVLIKPRTDFIESWPVVDQRHYIPCAVDFADVPEKIDHVLAHWDDYFEMRQRNRVRLLALRRPESLADRLAGIIRRRVGALE